MGSDISRSTFDPGKHYSGVRQQQGRVSVDADWNEQVDIASYRVSTEAVDVIGCSGAPRDNAGFQIQQLQSPAWLANTTYASGTYITDSNGNPEVAITGGTSATTPPTWPATVGGTITDGGVTWQRLAADLAISPGHIYVDGLLCELNATPVPIENFTGDGTAPAGTQAQVTNVVVDGSPLQQGDWVIISAEGTEAPKPLLVQIAAVNAATGELTFTVTVSQFEAPTDNPQSINNQQLQRVPVTYATQPDYPSAPALPSTGTSIIYLDVWEREITALEDPNIQEIALGGADTATRTKTVWQIKWVDVSSVSNVMCSTPDSGISPWGTATQASGGQLTTGVVQTQSSGPCSLSPNTGYTGVENQLYRVQIHQPGTPLSSAPSYPIPSGVASFKWSRENASVATSVTAINAVGSSGNAASQLTVLSTGRDDVLAFSPGDWIELTDDYLELGVQPGELSGQSGELHQIAVGGVDPTGATITLVDSVSQAFLTRFTNSPTNYHPRIVRWDQGGTEQGGNVYQVDGSGNSTVWLNLNGSTGDIPVPPPGTTLMLEDGVTVSFSLNPAGGSFNAGDYWIFAARTADASVESLNQAPPVGIEHHYSRLGVVTFGQTTWNVSDCRRIFPPLADPGIHVTGVSLPGGSPPGPLYNDSTVTIQALASGISVQFDTPLDASTITQPSPLPQPPPPASFVTASPLQATCYVTVDLPSPTGGALMWYTPVTLAATVTLESSQTITWLPSAGMVAALNSQISSSSPYLLAHLTLKGNSIWAQNNPDLYLDGDVIGVPYWDTSGVQHTGIQLPSGDGRRGGDFKLWFWLITAPTVTLSATSLSFGQGFFVSPVPVGTTSSPQTVTLSNNVGDLTFTVTATGDFAVNPSGNVPVAADAQATFSITFSPTAPGSRTGSVTFTSPGYSGPPLVITLSGMAVVLTVEVSTNNLAFSTVAVGQSSTLSVTLTNTGTAAIWLTGISNTNPVFSFANNCPAGGLLGGGIAPGASCSVSVSFTPNATGNFNDTLTITTNAPGPPIQISLSGSGFAAKGNIRDIKTSDIKTIDIKTADLKTADKVKSVDFKATDVKTADLIKTPQGVSSPVIANPVSPITEEPGLGGGLKAFIRPEERPPVGPAPAKPAQPPPDKEQKKE